MSVHALENTGVKKTFHIHAEGALKEIIFSQSLSHVKALAELVMNGEDYGATDIYVKIDEKGFKVSDNGTGFKSETDIDNYFATFCNPHNETDPKKFGRFRIGRGQIMALSAVTWRSNTFSMSVDLRNTSDTSFTFKAELEHKNGTTVSGLWNETANISLRELNKFFKYASANIFINGIQVNSSNNTWDYEDELCCIKLEPLGSYETNIYNQGAFVTELNRYSVGSTADVVSKIAFKLNTARNEISKDCPTWKHIHNVLHGLINTKKKASKKVDEYYRLYLIESLLEGTLKPDDLYDLSFRQKNGQYISLYNFLSSKKHCSLVPADAEKSKYDVLQSLGQHHLFSSHEIAHWGASNIGELLDILYAYSTKHRIGHIARKAKDKVRSIVDYEWIEQNVDYSKTAIKTADLTPIQSAQRNACQHIAKSMAKRISTAMKIDCPPRKVLIGECNNAAGWTDSVSVIYIEKKSLNLFQSYAGLVQIALLILHEYTHNIQNEETDEHGIVFYKGFHDAALPCSLSKDVVGNAIESLATRYAHELNSKGLPIPPYLNRLEHATRFEFFLKGKDASTPLLWVLEEAKLPYVIQRKEDITKLSITTSALKLEECMKRLSKSIESRIRKCNPNWVDPDAEFRHMGFEDLIKARDELRKKQASFWCHQEGLLSIDTYSVIFENRYIYDSLNSFVFASELGIVALKYFPDNQSYKFDLSTQHGKISTSATQSMRNPNDKTVFAIASDKGAQKRITQEAVKALINDIRDPELRSSIAKSLFKEDIFEDLIV
jgi:hypothetical protein